MQQHVELAKCGPRVGTFEIVLGTEQPCPAGLALAARDRAQRVEPSCDRRQEALARLHIGGHRPEQGRLLLICAVRPSETLDGIVGYEVERTKLQQVENIRVNLLHAASGIEMTLEFDDLSGETVEQAFATRYCPEKFVELVNNAEGMLLFLSANRKNDDAVTILDAFDAEEDATQPAADPNLWEPEKAPLQVQLVDLLQCLQRPPFEARPMKVALVVSAGIWHPTPVRTRRSG